MQLLPIQLFLLLFRGSYRTEPFPAGNKRHDRQQKPSLEDLLEGDVVSDHAGTHHCKCAVL